MRTGSWITAPVVAALGLASAPAAAQVSDEELAEYGVIDDVGEPGLREPEAFESEAFDSDEEFDDWSADEVAAASDVGPGYVDAEAPDYEAGEAGGESDEAWDADGTVERPASDDAYAYAYVVAPSAYRSVLVAGTHVSGFFYVRQDHFLNLPGGTDQARLAYAVVQGRGAFGPHPAGAKVRAKSGYSYWFLPVCGPAPTWTNKAFKSVPATGQLRVDLQCPT